MMKKKAVPLLGRPFGSPDHQQDAAYLARRCPAQARVQSRCTTRRRAIRIAMPATLVW